MCFTIWPTKEAHINRFSSLASDQSSKTSVNFLKDKCSNVWSLTLVSDTQLLNLFEFPRWYQSITQELWMEVCNTVREAVTKTIPKKKKCKKVKWLSEEALQIAEKRKAKGKGEKERYNHLNTDFQRTARRDNKGFLSNQCKEIKENTWDLFKKIRDKKATFNAKMGTIKDRNGMDLTETEDIKKRWQEYTECVSRSVVSNTLWPQGL